MHIGILLDSPVQLDDELRCRENGTLRLNIYRECLNIVNLADTFLMRVKSRSSNTDLGVCSKGRQSRRITRRVHQERWFLVGTLSD